ncbi:unnamed protein product [Lampetra fluviatilis]
MVSSDGEDGGDVIPQTTPSVATPEKFQEAAVPAEQREETDVSALSSSGERLADLLFTAAALVAKLDMEEPEEYARVQEPHVDSPAAAGCHAREKGELQAAQAAAILLAGQDATPAKLDFPPNSQGEQRSTPSHPWTE